MNKPEVTLYTDGSSLGNPGPGGWAAVLKAQDHHKELSGGYARTTNNRMEIKALVEGLKALKRPCRVTAFTDSRYLCDALSKNWIGKWQRNGWKTATKNPVKNIDLWKELLAAMDDHDMSVHWVKAHDGQEENERCDLLAKQAAQGPSLPADPGMGS